jgi:hypothetical protein
MTTITPMGKASAMVSLIAYPGEKSTQALPCGSDNTGKNEQRSLYMVILAMKTLEAIQPAAAGN